MVSVSFIFYLSRLMEEGTAGVEESLGGNWEEGERG